MEDGDLCGLRRRFETMLHMARGKEPTEEHTSRACGILGVSAATLIPDPTTAYCIALFLFFGQRQVFSGLPIVASMSAFQLLPSQKHLTLSRKWLRALVQALGLERQIKLITQLIPTRDGRRAAEAITGIPGDPRAVPASESSIISGPVAAVEAFQTHYGVKRHHVESSICNGLPPWGDSDVKRPKLSLEAVIESVGGVAQLTRLLLDSYDDLLEQAAAAENKKSADEATVANVTEQLCSWLHWHGVWLDRLPSQPLELISRIRKHWAPRRGQSRDLLGNPGILDRRGSVHAAAVRLAALAPSSSHSSKGSTIPPRRDARRPLRILLNRMVSGSDMGSVAASLAVTAVRIPEEALAQVVATASRQPKMSTSLAKVLLRVDGPAVTAASQDDWLVRRNTGPRTDEKKSADEIKKAATDSALPNQYLVLELARRALQGATGAAADRSRQIVFGNVSRFVRELLIPRSPGVPAFSVAEVTDGLLLPALRHAAEKENIFSAAGRVLPLVRACAEAAGAPSARYFIKKSANVGIPEWERILIALLCPKGAEAKRAGAASPSARTDYETAIQVAVNFSARHFTRAGSVVSSGGVATVWPRLLSAYASDRVTWLQREQLRPVVAAVTRATGQGLEFNFSASLIGLEFYESEVDASVRVDTVASMSPAANAGVPPNARLVRYNRHEITDSDSLDRAADEGEPRVLVFEYPALPGFRDVLALLVDQIHPAHAILPQSAGSAGSAALMRSHFLSLFLSVFRFATANEACAQRLAFSLSAAARGLTRRKIKDIFPGSCGEDIKAVVAVASQGELGWACETSQDEWARVRILGVAISAATLAPAWVAAAPVDTDGSRTAEKIIKIRPDKVTPDWRALYSYASVVAAAGGGKGGLAMWTAAAVALGAAISTCSTAGLRRVHSALLPQLESLGLLGSLAPFATAEKLNIQALPLGTLVRVVLAPSNTTPKRTIRNFIFSAALGAVERAVVDNEPAGGSGLLSRLSPQNHVNVSQLITAATDAAAAEKMKTGDAPAEKIKMDVPLVLSLCVLCVRSKARGVHSVVDSAVLLLDKTKSARGSQAEHLSATAAAAARILVDRIKTALDRLGKDVDVDGAGGWERARRRVASAVKRAEVGLGSSSEEAKGSTK